MRIELTKRADGSSTLRCIRSDHSITWRHSPTPLSELTRYIVEQYLGFQKGFWGQVAAGADLAAGTNTPEEAAESARMTAKLDIELAGAITWNVAEFNLNAARPLTEAEMDGLRAARDTLFRRWIALLPGDVLTLDF